MNFDSLSITLLSELNNVCDAFEDAWRAGRRPRIEDFLDGRTERDRTVLFQMLMEIEIELRREAGERIDPDDYVNRFDAYADVIRTMFASTSLDVANELKLPSTYEPPPSSGAANPQATTAALVPGEPQWAAAPASTAAPERIGRYQILRFLGEGNFVVYLARDERDGRDVAIKVARPNMPEIRRRLMSLFDEAEKIKALEHPRIVRLYEYVPPGQPGIGSDGYIVLEYVDGRDGERTLEELLRTGPIPLPRLIRIVTLVAEALHYAHTHRRSPGAPRLEAREHPARSRGRAANLRLRPGRQRGHPAAAPGRGRRDSGLHGARAGPRRIAPPRWPHRHLGPGRHPLPWVDRQAPVPWRRPLSDLRGDSPPRSQAAPHVRTRHRAGARADRVCAACRVPWRIGTGPRPTWPTT